MLIYTLVLLVFLPSGDIEAVQQHFDNKQEGLVGGATVIRAYAHEFNQAFVYPVCIQGWEA